MSWIVRRPAGAAARWEASFPQFDAASRPHALPEYVELASGSQRACLKSTTRRGARGDEVFLSAGTLSDVADGAQVTSIASSVHRYRWARLLHDPEQRATLIGLVIACIGLAIDTSLAIGNASPSSVVIELSDPQIAVVVIASALMKLIGLWLVFWKGVLGAK